MVQEMRDKVDRGVAAILKHAEEAEAAVHHIAQDVHHAKTCRALQDARSAMDQAAQQHATATKQMAQAGRTAAAAVAAAAAATAESTRSARVRMEQEVSALRAKAGLRAM